MTTTDAGESAAVIFDHLKNGDTHPDEVMELQAIHKDLRAELAGLKERVDAQDAFGDLITALDDTLSNLSGDVATTTAIAAQVQPLLVEFMALKGRGQELKAEELRVRTLEAEALKESAANNISLLEIMKRRDVWAAMGALIPTAGGVGGLLTFLFGGS